MRGLVHKITDHFIQWDIHGALPFPLPPFALHVGAEFLFAGCGEKDNGGSILADGAPVVSREFSVEHWIVHYNVLPPWPVNLMLAVIIPFAENTLHFATSSVLGPSGPLAVALAETQGPSLACNDPFNMLTSTVYTAGTVFVGYTYADVRAAMTMVTRDMLLSAISNFIGGKIGGKIADPLGEAAEDVIKGLYGKTAKDALENFFEELIGDNAEEVVEAVAGDFVAQLMLSVESPVESLVGDVVEMHTPDPFLTLVSELQTNSAPSTNEVLDTARLFGPSEGLSILDAQSEYLPTD